MSSQRSSWAPTWPPSAPEAAQPAAASKPNPPPRAPVPPVIRPPAGAGGLGRPGTPPPPSYPPLSAPVHQSNSAVLADLARQARTARGELQAAQEAFARRALTLYESLRMIDDSLVQLATHVLGNSVIASTWLCSRNHHLSQRSPLEVLMVGDREAVVNELMRLEHGVY